MSHNTSVLNNALSRSLHMHLSISLDKDHLKKRLRRCGLHEGYVNSLQHSESAISNDCWSSSGARWGGEALITWNLFATDRHAEFERFLTQYLPIFSVELSRTRDS